MKTENVNHHDKLTNDDDEKQIMFNYFYLNIYKHK